jgi:tRNA modification GTPase
VESPSCAILLTPPGAAAIAVVRLSGPRLAAFLETHFSKTAKPGRCVHGELRNGDQVVDDPVIMLSAGGSSADVNLHGGPWVVQAILDLARRDGFEIVESGVPLTDGAVDANSILEREMLSHLLLAKTREAIAMLLAQPRAWKKLEHANREEIQGVLNDRTLWRMLHTPRVAIVGAPNVGKSTLANQLFAQERSITADVPGTTRDWVGEIANLDGLAVMLVDTPGMRETSDEIERAAIVGSGRVVESADLVVLVIDASHPDDAEQGEVMRRFPDALRVANKKDLAKRSIANAIGTVATTGEGMDELRAGIRARLGCVDLDSHKPRWWTQRQREHLQEAAGQ